MYELLDFYADWCGPCKIMSPIIEQVEKELKGKFTLKKIDVDAEGELAGKYGVMAIPTFVLLKDGKELDRKEGAIPKEMIKSWLETKLK